jgi:hypothetical protein
LGLVCPKAFCASFSAARIKRSSRCALIVTTKSIVARARSGNTIANKISAKIDQGVVSLTLPKAEHARPRKITVS